MDPINNSIHGKPNAREIMDQFLAQGLPKEDASVELPAAVAEILAGASLKLTNMPANPGKSFNDQTTIPELDGPDAVVGSSFDWALLAAKLKDDNDKYQAKIAAAAIKKQQGEIDANAKEHLAKVNDSLKKMDKAAKMGVFMKVFGWLMVGISLVMAAATCGAAGGLVAGAVLGAVAATTLQVLNETGVMEKMTKAIADGLKKSGCKSPAADILAAVFTALFEIGIGLGASFGGAKFAASRIAGIVKKGMDAGMKAEQVLDIIAKKTILRTMTMAANAMKQLSGNLRYLPLIMKYADWGFKAVGLGAQTGAAKINYDSGVASSEVTKHKGKGKSQSKKLEELMDTMNEIFAQLMSSADVIANLLIRTDEEKLAIAVRAEQMA